MKKMIFIIMLQTVLTGCAGQTPDPGPAAPLLAFNELTEQIKVSHEDVSDAPVEEFSHTTVPDVAP